MIDNKCINKMMAKQYKPKIVQLLENLLWVHSPRHWIFSTKYRNKTLEVHAMVETIKRGNYKSIVKYISIDTINERTQDIWGFAEDYIDMIKAEMDKV